MNNLKSITQKNTLLYSPDVTPHHWVLPHRQNFHEFIDTHFIYPRDQNKPSECELYEHQRSIKDLLQPLSPLRGLLLFHSLGTGKGRSTIATCGQYSSDKKVYILLPASLADNFSQELQNCAFPKTNTNSNKQLENSMYTLIHYNGNDRHFRELMANMDGENETCFDDCIVVIDEVHNFISRVLNARTRNATTVATRMYDQIVRANRVKVLALSGTPLINKAIEISYLMNMITGTLKSYKFFSPYTNENVAFLKMHRYVDDFTYQNGCFHVALLPHDFMQRKQLKGSTKVSDSIIHISKLKFQESKSVQQLIQELKETLSPTKDVLTSFTDMFPLDEKVFESLFVSDNVVYNPRLLSTRLSGLISHYDVPSNHEHFPSFDGISVEYIEMSDYQATVYTSVRNIEKDKESRDRKKNVGEKMTDSNTANYKSFSRMACNFVFPEKYKRPVQAKSTRRTSISKKIVLNFDDASEEEDESDPNFNADIQTTIDLIKRDKYFTLDNLSGASGLSPKFARLIENVHASPGPCLVYSFFRKIEGIALLKAAFEEFGYHHLEINKNGLTLPVHKYKPCFIIFTDDKIQNTQLLNIFNSVFGTLDSNMLRQINDYRAKHNMIEEGNDHGILIKVLMITQSGAEGISLKCIRQVHLLEPYWHQTRTQQVIGRAMRSNSHKTLPNDERRVKAVLYLSIFKDRASKSILQTKEETTDEWIYKLGEKKQKNLDSFLNIMKRAAINCRDETSCFRPYVLENKIDTNSFSMFDVNTDPKDAECVFHQNIQDFQALKDVYINKKQLWVNEKTCLVHVKQDVEFDDVMDMNPIGIIVKEQDGRNRLVIY